MTTPATLSTSELRKASQGLDLLALDAHIAARPKKKGMVIEQAWMDAILSDRDIQAMEKLAAWTKNHAVPRPDSLFGIAFSCNRPHALSWLLDTQDWQLLRTPPSLDPGPNLQDQVWLANRAIPILQQHWRQKTSLLDSCIVLMERFPDLFVSVPPQAPRRADEVLTCALDRSLSQSDPNLIHRFLNWMEPLSLLSGPPHAPGTFSQHWILSLFDDTNTSRVIGLYDLAQQDSGLRETVDGFFPVSPGFRGGSNPLTAKTVGEYLLIVASPSIVDVMDLPPTHHLRASVQSALVDDACFAAFLRRASASNPGLLYRVVSRNKDIAERFLNYEESPGTNSAHIVLSARAHPSLKQPWTAMERWLLSNAGSLLDQPLPSGQSVHDYCAQEFPLFCVKLRRHQLALSARQSRPASSLKAPPRSRM